MIRTQCTSASARTNMYSTDSMRSTASVSTIWMGLISQRNSRMILRNVTTSDETLKTVHQCHPLRSRWIRQKEFFDLFSNGIRRKRIWKRPIMKQNSSSRLTETIHCIDERSSLTVLASQFHSPLLFFVHGILII